MDLGLTDRVYVLTGASRGLGYATAQSLVADGARVVLSARDPEAVATAAQQLGGPEHAVGLTADLTDPGNPGAARRRRPGALRPARRRADLGRRPTGRQRRGDHRRAVAALLRNRLPRHHPGGPHDRRRTARGRRDRAGALHLGPRPGARPGHLQRPAARPGRRGQGHRRRLRPAWGPGGRAAARPDPDRPQRELFAATGDPDRARADAEATIPLRRLGDPAEFGRVAAFVLSPAASYLTGITLPVDGGALRGL